MLFLRLILSQSLRKRRNSLVLGSFEVSFIIGLNQTDSLV